ncbi:glucosamine-6-phosphate deaminase [Ornithinibacillus sp. 4-3]|uniref:Glucosamine-6-phosphate deaminase n=1 Tax=Ornithinibacillus sp. 4-3 TaxID=3231488 RepID=A0AB39HP59_9BACI
MKIIKVKDYEELSKKACEVFVQKLQTIANPVLGLATGSTPEGLYECLIGQYKQNKVSFKNATTFNLDEYIGLPNDHDQSYHYFMNEKLFKHIDLPKERAHVPSGVVADLEKECHDYEQAIKEQGPIDLQLLGMGPNGHIAFNEPGTSFESRTAIYDLTESTRNANARFFDSIDEVPTKAISMGIGTIMDAKEILFIVSGESKAEILAKVLEGKADPSIPATVLHLHDNVTVIADEAALSKYKG